jgi:hypothetical protein
MTEEITDLQEMARIEHKDTWSPYLNFDFISKLLLLLLSSSSSSSSSSLTTILQLGLFPVAVLQKLDVYKKMDIHSKETKHTSHDKAARTSHEETAYLTKYHSTVQVQ